MVGFMEPHRSNIWSTTDKNAAFTNTSALVITNASSSSFVSARSNRKLDPKQKLYFEMTATKASGNWACGVANANASLSNYGGADTNGITYYSGNTGTISYNATSTGSYGNIATGGIVGIAVDGINSKFWIRLTATGLWNNAALSSSDPANNLGGYSCPGIFGSGPIFLLFTSSTTTEAATLNAGSSAFNGTPPLGFRSPNSASAR